MQRKPIDLVVLDTIADDLESIEQIVDRLGRATLPWQKAADGSPFTRHDVFTALLRLIQDGLAEGFRSELGGLVKIGAGALPCGDLDDYWFGITAHGLMVHANWDPDK